MSIDEQHIALPKLYGAPAYARPERPGRDGPAPVHPDDLPIEALMTEEEREFASSLPARAWAPGGAIVDLGTRRRWARWPRPASGLQPKP